ncbi:MAG: DUF59 domain-containing protein [Leptospiraceae bacterium]|nr:DUF59 domain-containing protein [Leptospiraceae bacterium]
MSTEDSNGNTLVRQAWDALGGIEDPELGLSITELGLIYDIKADPENNLDVTMTFTSMACPYGPQLQAESQLRLSKIENVREARVEVVFNPPWDPRSMASEDARAFLGIYE